MLTFLDVGTFFICSGGKQWKSNIDSVEMKSDKSSWISLRLVSAAASISLIAVGLAVGVAVTA